MGYDTFVPSHRQKWAVLRGTRSRLFSVAAAVALLSPVSLLRADEPAAATVSEAAFTDRTAALGKALASIGGRLEEVTQLRARAQKDGAAVKLSCIDEKLRRIRASLEAGKVIEGGWRFARTDDAYAARSTDRVNILALLAAANADAAYACSDASAAATTMTHVDVAVDVPAGDVVRPPVIERPPLASPY